MKTTHLKLGVCAFPLSKGLETGRGLERVIQEFCDVLDRHRVRYEFFHLGLIRSEFRALGKSLRYGLELFRARFDVYFAVYPVAAIFPIILGKKPLVTGVHDLIPFQVSGMDNFFKYLIKRICIRVACKKSQKLIVPFASTKIEIIHRFGVSGDKIEVVALGVNHQNYFVDPSFSKKPFQIAFLGEAKRAKGADIAILAFKKILATIPSARLVVASNGNELELMKTLAADNLPAHSYSFVGFVPETQMREFYSQTKVFLFPSRYGFGLSSLEAMACGTPAIVGSCLDALDFISDGDLIESIDNVEGFALKVCRLLEDEDLYREKVREGLVIAQKYSWEKMALTWNQICRDQVSNGPGA